jgi:hypothetical protein
LDLLEMIVEADRERRLTIAHPRRRNKQVLRHV